MSCLSPRRKEEDVSNTGNWIAAACGQMYFIITKHDKKPKDT